MESNIGNRFSNLTQEEQMDVDGGFVLLAIVIGCAVAGIVSLVAAPIIYHDLKNVYTNGYNEVRYK